VYLYQSRCDLHCPRNYAASLCIRAQLRPPELVLPVLECSMEIGKKRGFERSVLGVLEEKAHQIVARIMSVSKRSGMNQRKQARELPSCAAKLCRPVIHRHDAANGLEGKVAADPEAAKRLRIGRRSPFLADVTKPPPGHQRRIFINWDLKPSQK
jgi:hypothetical protein